MVPPDSWISVALQRRARGVKPLSPVGYLTPVAGGIPSSRRGQRAFPFTHSRRMRQTNLVFIAAAVMLATGCRAPRSSAIETSGGRTVPMSDGRVVQDEGGAPLMMLGVFHFASSGDAFRSQVPFDVLTPARQREVEELVDRLAAFRPTHVAVEALPERQRRLDSLYAAYVAGTYTLGANEIFQLGFRVARRLGHSRVYAVDARMRSYTTYESLQASLAALAQTPMLTLADQPWGARYWRLFQRDDSLKATQPLRDHLAYLNSEPRLRASMGANLIGLFRAGNDTLPLGPDWVTQSFNRDLRIFRNLQRLAEQPGSRTLLIIGASHIPTLRMLAESSPDIHHHPVGPYLR